MNFIEKIRLREKNREYFKKIYGDDFILEKSEEELLYEKNQSFINKFRK